VKKPTHVLCNCPGLPETGTLTEIDRDLDFMSCARCGSTNVDPVCLVACPTPHRSPRNLDELMRGCVLPFHDYARDAHVVPWEKRDLLVFD
jgi:hypothetical protein